MFTIIYITHPDKATAQQIAQHLVSEKLVACANIFPMQSTYWWNGVAENDDEWVSIVKTRTENWDRVQDTVKKIHPYEVPCIMKWEVEANAAYEQWICENTTTSNTL